MNWLYEPWNWYVAGPLIGLFVPILLITTNKMLGLSSSFEHLCILLLPPNKREMFKFNMQENGWKLSFMVGIGIGALIVAQFMSSAPIHFLPEQYHTLQGYAKLFIGGILVGFGTRYANGCTSGHSIFGLSILQTSSLKATLAFFAGGLLYTFLETYW
jgi:uncharacterized membrane protein YedE/YeeE